MLLDRYWCIFSIFSVFSRFDHVLKHSLWCFGISFLFFWWFFNFWTSFADFHDFERFCIHGESKATPGATKMNAFLYIFAGRSTARVFDQCNTGLRIFCGHFVVNFRRFWAIFASMAWAKQHRERQKWTQFDAFSQVKRRRAFLTIATPGSCFFVLILRWFYMYFGVILRDFAHPSGSLV